MEQNHFFSCGVIYGCVQLLGSINTHPNSFKKPSELPSYRRFNNEELISLMLKLGWIVKNNTGLIELSSFGLKILSLNEEIFLLREALFSYIKAFRPPWIQLILGGRSKVLLFAPHEIKQIMIDAEIHESYSKEVVKFWDNLAALAYYEKEIKLNDIGREGERLSLTYEKLRTGISPEWIAIENNADGFDIISVIDKGSEVKQYIEVKTSTMGLLGKCFITRNEWTQSQLLPHYIFHLWDISERDAPRLAILESIMIQKHIPANDTGMGRWESISIPFEAFATDFKNVNVNEKY